MTIKKMLMFASAIAALVAFAVPAVASAAEWYVDPGGNVANKTTLNADTNVTGTGRLSFTAGGLESGPCNVDFAATITNMGGNAKAVINSFTITTPCPTNLSFLGCEVESASNNTEEGAEWGVSTEGDTATIEGVSFTNHYNSACQGLGVPAEATAEGNAVGEIETGTGCIKFENAGELESAVIGPGELNGQVCIGNMGTDVITLD